MNLRAELIADRGAAASGPDFFRSPGFLEAEGATHSLVLADADEPTVRVLTAPLVVREIPGTDRVDAISPYGYPGADRADRLPDGVALPIDPAATDFSATGLATIFLRHALGAEVPLTGATGRNVCLLSDPSLPRKSRMSDRQQIRKNLKRGYEIEIVPGPESSPEQKAGFLAAYTETMVRTEAAERYFFDAAYFDLILSEDSTCLVIARAGDGGIAAASIGARSDGLLHYYLSGTADAYLRDSPMKNVIEAMIELGAERDLPVNFGGGITPGDALEEFKRGFANREERWFTSEITCDREVVEELTAAWSERTGTVPDPDFFPPYRA